MKKARKRKRTSTATLYFPQLLRAIMIRPGERSVSSTPLTRKSGGKFYWISSWGVSLPDLCFLKKSFSWVRYCIALYTYIHTCVQPASRPALSLNLFSRAFPDRPICAQINKVLFGKFIEVKGSFFYFPPPDALPLANLPTYIHI